LNVSTPNPFETAALPFAVFVVTSLQSLVNSLDPNPVIAAGQIPGALQVLLPSLAASEFGAAKGAISAQLGGVLTKLNSLSPTPAA
jgi:hypothetical protein